MPDVAPDLFALALRWRLPDAPPLLPPPKPPARGGALAPGSAGTDPLVADAGPAIDLANAAAERDAYEERAAILEYDAGLPRAEAERRAAEMHLARGRPREATEEGSRDARPLGSPSVRPS